MSPILEAAAVIAAVGLYLIPSIEADAREHRDAFAITMVNVLPGWTVVGWFAARAWARRRNDERLFPRVGVAKGTRGATGRVTITSRKIADRVKLRAALACRGRTAASRVAEQCS